MPCPSATSKRRLMYPRLHIGSLEIGSYLLCGVAALAVATGLALRKLKDWDE